MKVPHGHWKDFEQRFATILERRVLSKPDPGAVQSAAGVARQWGASDISHLKDAINGSARKNSNDVRTALELARVS